MVQWISFRMFLMVLFACVGPRLTLTKIVNDDLIPTVQSTSIPLLYLAAALKMK
jgi:hypothetical protein